MSSKKGRSSKSDDRKGKRSEESTPQPVEKKDEVEPEPAAVEETTLVAEEAPPKPPSPEPVYEEPVLTALIVESYEGGKEKGLYEGDGIANFAGGHVYEGNFSGGMMHGFGVYTWADGVQYKGTFTHNHVTGKGQYSWPDGSSYDGDVLDGIRHGFGSYTARNNMKSYTGEWKYGKRHGKGRMNYDAEGNSFYEGDWLENCRHGYGTRGYASGNVYEGMWFQDMRHGEGTMRWIDRDEMYTGQWEKGIQHGTGQHIWFLRRVASSQYPMRNMYEGDFVSGLRHGKGNFFYANGSRYEGSWKDNMKHGQGKFVFKNGRIYEGLFEKDHIVEFPSFTIDGSCTPDMANIRTRTPLPAEAMSIHSNDSRNTLSPSFQLEVDRLLSDRDELDSEEECRQAMYVLLRYMSKLRKIYGFYSCLGYEESPDNTFIMNRMQFWRFLKDVKLHHHEITLMEMDRIIANVCTHENIDNIHSPDHQILFREFITFLVVIAYAVYEEDYGDDSSPVLAWCLGKLINENVLSHACCVQGYFYHETRRAVNALFHVDKAFEVYKSLCTSRKNNCKEKVLKMRQFLYMLKDYKLINEDLTAKAIIDILSADDPNVCDGQGAVNMEIEMTFLEFFEALVGCSQIFVTEAVAKDPNTPRPSTMMTREQSSVSLPGTSRMASQAEYGQDDATAHDSESPMPLASTPGHATPSVDTKLDPGNPSHTATNTSSGTEAQLAGKAADVEDQKKSHSQMSNQSEVNQAMTQSLVSMGDVSEYAHTMTAGEEEEEEADEEELDEFTRLFNFWTHQVHIFFVRKFFPAAEKLAILKHRVIQKYCQTHCHQKDCLNFYSDLPRQQPEVEVPVTPEVISPSIPPPEDTPSVEVEAAA